MIMDDQQSAAAAIGRGPRGGGSPARGNAVQACIEAIRELILNRSLLPGEQIRQGEMAERLGVSRVPVREALKVLETEGVLSHKPNQGYFVTRLRAAELSQIYRMRELLESELLNSLVWPDEEQIEQIVMLNDQIAATKGKDDVRLIVALNREFHFHIFNLSPYKIICKEVERLWSLSEPYRAVYLYGSEARVRIVKEHTEIIKALVERDEQALIEISSRHRQGLHAHMVRFLEPDGLQPTLDAGLAPSESPPEAILR